MNTRKLIGIITDYCEEHSAYEAMFPSLDGFSFTTVEGAIHKLPLESQIMIDLGACIVAEITENGDVLKVFCPLLDILKPGSSVTETESWLKAAREKVGYGEGEEAVKEQKWDDGIEDAPI